jgi:hypothetical protein
MIMDIETIKSLRQGDTVKAGGHTCRFLQMNGTDDMLLEMRGIHIVVPSAEVYALNGTHE